MLSCVLVVGTLTGVSSSAGCRRVPEARARGANASQDLPCSDESTLSTTVDFPADQRDSERIAREWGIEPLGINLSAAGYLLDFRYRIADPEKARAFVARSVKPYLIDQATGARMYVPSPPKVGRLQQTSRKPTAGRIHFVLFANPGRFVKPGAEVTLVFGDCKLGDLVVNGPIQQVSVAASNAGQCIDNTP
jgi:hypothetical protein